MIRARFFTALSLGLLAVVGGCGPRQTATATEADAEVSNTGSADTEIAMGETSLDLTAGSVASGPSLTATGQPVDLVVQSEDRLQTMASVVQLDAFPDQNMKVFGSAGGDPAMNGLYTRLAFFNGVADGWAIYDLGDFASYRVLGVGEGRLELEIIENTLDEATAEIGDRSRRVVVGWVPDPDGLAPSNVTMSPAR